MVMNILQEILDLALSAAPWLLLGLLAAGAVKAWVPETQMRRWVGGRGFAGVARGAMIGAPLPLCSCGAIPTGIALYRGGAGRGPTTAFMIGTPGIGVDSLAISYALLGPFMMLARALGAVVTAIVTGLLVGLSRGGGRGRNAAEATADGVCTEEACSCQDHGHAPERADAGAAVRLAHGLRYVFTELLDDIGPWILGGVIMAGVLVALVPEAWLAGLEGGLLTLVTLSLVGIPLYICATAATPVAAGLLLAGLSPGAVLVFLLAGPVTSLATLGVLRREMGNAALTFYLGGIVVSTVVLGLGLDLLVGALGLDVSAQAGAVRELTPTWLGYAALALLLAVGLRPLRRGLAGLGRRVTLPV
ncbi:MAG: SO_0444 family Cu/Zn efflux transporter [Ectothiorhodospira sp.]